MKRALFILAGVIALIILLAILSGPRDGEPRNRHGATDPAEEILEPTLGLDAEYTQVGVQKAGTSAPLIEFEQADYEYALTQGKKVALLFFSDHCPSCRKEIANEVVPAFDQLDRDDLVGFLVNFDDRRTDANEDALAHEFQVPGRHTKVFLDTDGSVIRKTAPENWTTAQYLEVLGGLE